MRKMVCSVLVFCLGMSGIASAVSARITPQAGKIGHLSKAQSGYNGTSTSTFGGGYIMSVGDAYDGFYYDLGVIKFKLPSEITPSVAIDSAQIKGYCYASGTVYMKIQRYANDNLLFLGADDHPSTASLVDVAVVPVVGGYFNWDVTSAVAADVAAGKTHTSFLFTAVQDAAGTPLAPGGPEYYHIWVAEGWSYESTPHLNINNASYPILPAEVVRVVPKTGEIGHLKEARFGYNGVSTTQFLGAYIMNIGDGYDGGFNYDLGVIKFELPSQIDASDTINSAQINLYCWSTGVVWLKVQRYVNDNTTPLGESDYPDNANLVDVTIMPSAHSNYFSLDVTEGVAADVAAGKTYSSYLITAVLDSAGTPLGLGLQPEFWCVTVVEGWSEASMPHMLINFTPEPNDCAEVIASGFGLFADLNQDCAVDMTDLTTVVDKWLSCTTPGGAGCLLGEVVEPTGTIARGTITIDGNLNEWSNAEWIPINYNIYGDPSDVTEAKMALRWNPDTDKVYAAVVVTDTNHFFTSDYDLEWDSSDRIEIFSQGSNAGGAYDTYLSDKAQQYFFGSNGSGGYWSSWVGGWPLMGSPDPNFEGIAVVNGSNIIYELGVQMFDNYAGRPGSSGDTIITPLEVGKLVRFDVVVDTRWGIVSSESGVLAASAATNRAVNADNIAQYELVEATPCGGWGYWTGDLSRNCVVNLEDMYFLAEAWLVCNRPQDENCIENWW